MNIESLDLNLLVVMRVLNECRSTTRAAQILHVSQPAISHALKRLRERLDDPVFERRGRTLVPTAQTERFLSSTEAAWQSLSRALANLDRFDPHTSTQSFVIGLNNAFENIMLPGLMTRIAQDAPHLSVASQAVSRSDLLDGLLNTKLDLALDASVHVNEQIEQQRVLQSDYVVIARPDHPALAAPMTLDTYLAQRHLLVSRRVDGPGLEDERLQHLGHQRDIALRCQSVWTACQVVAQTDCLLTVPEVFIAQIRQLMPFSMAALPVAGLSLSVFMYWHRSRTDDAGSKWLRGEVVRSLGGLSDG